MIDELAEQGVFWPELQANVSKELGTELVEEMTILTDQAFSKIGAPMELVSAFGGKSGYLQAVQELEALLYSKPQSA